MQRTIRYFYCAVIALLAMSCEKVGNDPNVNRKPFSIPETISAHTPAFDTKTRSFQGGGLIEDAPESWDGTETVETRTYAVVDGATIDPNTGEAGEYYQYWSEGDAISLFLTRANLKYVMEYYKYGTLDIGEFKLSGDKTEGDPIITDYFYSVYPYKENTTITSEGIVTYEFPNIQHYSEDSYSNGENGMIAIEPKNGTDSVLYFQNFCSYLQLRLVSTDTTTPLTVSKIVLTANNSANNIAGGGYIEVINEDSVPVVEMSSEPIVEMKNAATNQITLDCGGGVELSADVNDPTKFWFVLPGACTFSDGFNISVVFDNNKYYKKSTKKQIGIDRSHIQPMATFEPELLDPTGPIRYKYNDTSNTEPFHVSNTFFGEGGVVLNVVGQVYDEETEEWVILLDGTLKAIGDNSFESEGPDIEYIKIDNEEESVAINNFAFYNCTADSLIVYSPLDKIGNSVFNASTITDLNVYADVNTICNGVAKGSVIENINIKGSVGEIEKQAFNSSATIKSVDVDGDIGKIGANAFNRCPNFEDFVVGGDIGKIEQMAFYECDQLDNLTVEGNVTTIGSKAFYDCDDIKNIHIHGDIDKIESQAFYRCDELEKVEIYGHLESIGKQAFSDCDNLKVVEIKEGVDIIGEEAFNDCDELEEVKIVGGVEKIDKRAFFDCDALHTVEINGNIGTIGEEAFALCDNITSIDIVGNIGKIEEKAFYDSDELETINITGDIGTIGEGVFSLCDSLVEVNIDGSIGTIAGETFADCFSLETVNISGSVESFESYVFSGCSSLTEVTVGSVKSIGDYAFYECYCLTTIVIPDVEYIGIGAFQNCSSIQTLELTSVITIEDSAFMDCWSLESVVISKNCTMIGEGAFCNATSLSEVYLNAVNPPFIKTDNDKGSYVFDGVAPNICIYIPAGSKNKYENPKYFSNNVYDDPAVKATVNWWCEEYIDILKEI